MLLVHISLTCRAAHGTEDGTAHAADRPGQEGSLRALVRPPGPDAVAGRAPAHPRLPEPARRKLRAERRGRTDGAGSTPRDGFRRRLAGRREAAQQALTGPR